MIELALNIVALFIIIWAFFVVLAIVANIISLFFK